MRRFWGTVLLVGMYVLALFLPVVDIGNDGRISDPVPGFWAFREGIAWPGTICWLANVTLAIGWASYAFGDPRIARWFGWVGVALSLSAPVVYGFLLQDFRVGYGVWVLCSVALAVLASLEIAPPTPTNGTSIRLSGAPPPES